MQKDSLPEVIHDTFLNEVSKRIITEDFLIEATVAVLFFCIKILICFVVFYLGKKLFSMSLRTYYKSSAHQKLNKALQSFLQSMFSLLEHLVLFIMCLLILGVHSTTLLAILGTLGIGIGLALKDNLSNFAGGIILLFFKTYSVGDEVIISNERGYVQKIDIFCTTILTFDGTVVLVPNGNIINNKIINYETTPHRRLEIIISVDYSTDLGLARSLLEDFTKEHPLVLKDKPVYTYIKNYANSSINIELRAWTRNEDFWHLYQDIQNSTKTLLDAKNISIPFPQLDLHIKKGS